MLNPEHAQERQQDVGWTQGHDGVHEADARVGPLTLAADDDGDASLHDEGRRADEQDEAEPRGAATDTKTASSTTSCT